MIVNLPLGFVNAVRAGAVIDGGSIPVRDRGCDRPQLVDDIGETGGEPKFRELEPNGSLAAENRLGQARRLSLQLSRRAMDVPPPP